MMKKLLRFFLGDEKEKKESGKDWRVLELENQIKDLRSEIFVLNSKNKKELPHPVVGVDLGDPSPVDGEKRKDYVGKVAGFHFEVMKPKLIQMISDGRAQFEKIDRQTFGLSQSEYDLFLKGTINGLWLIHDWGEMMINEKLSYQQEHEELSEEDKKLLKNKLQE